ncbi:GPW/gp25 family protein [Pseudogemmobacter blasticus]|uniref:Phage baseplate protein n=1 Tax=Fuscovulum blasticum DSM 2131 TaxID=1188250 RepID=A0A2T4JDM2_FUSBL|nr:GPW/gp25 family protein [Fuscovulum blasticum]PTE15917.1 phage baseplate protein [Fuscovulum blasticum DSM 2131]
MTGLSRTTARLIGFDAHLAQSINDILSTPKGSRVLRRDYGSRLPDLIDAPMNGETAIDVFAETAEALEKWEPRLRLRRVEITAAAAGRMSLLLTADVTDTEAAIEVTL